MGYHLERAAPASVNRSFRVERSSKRTPNADSRLAIRRLTVATGTAIKDAA
ncbi:hypothetical protein MNBD_GAMMA16-563, partial [hydrothermal vent metagenome]